MSSISAVIERARAGGVYTEKKRFTIARGRAIEKMRRFALADPYFYILELIQAAVANDAEYIEISTDDGEMTLAYVGGGLKKDDLANLFDYLFASKDRADIGHLRELALGINAALLFKPDRVIVESGDGTLQGTTRMEMHGAHDGVDIGTPERALTGTFIRIEGMSRGKLPKVLQRILDLGDRPREFDVVDVRCLAAPVPIILNHDSLFGFSAQRTPGMLGYRRTLSFDEGDLYGTLALANAGTRSEFDLLMWGVLIQSREHDLVRGTSLAGIVCFDRLRKTADHSGIVDDERMAEMWARLQPYAHELIHGNSARGITTLTQLDGTLVPATEVRPMVRENRRVILTPPRTVDSEHDRGIAREISRRLGAPVFCGHESMASSLRAMSAGALSVVSFDPANASDVAALRQSESEPPARPWLTPVIDLEPLTTADVLARIIGVHRAYDADDPAVQAEARNKAWWLGTGGNVNAAVFTPQSVRSTDALTVEVLTTQRLLWSGSLPSSHPGHVLRIELPDAKPSVLVSKRLKGTQDALCLDVARVMAVHAAPALRRAAGRAVESLSDRDVQPRTPAAALALRAAVRTCVPRLGTTDEGKPRVVLEQIDANHLDLRNLPLFRTLGGGALSLQQVAAAMSRCEGLIYGVLEGVPASLEGLDTSEVLSLDLEEERRVIQIFGESSYIRIDEREVLAQHGEACVRDIAVGLRSYPDHPLLVEVGDPAAHEAELVRGLIDRFVGRSPTAPPETWPREAWQECRRHAGRILQHYVCELLRRGLETPVPEVFELPLFLDPDDGAFCVAGVVDAMRRPGGLPLVYGHAFGGAELGALAKASESETAASGMPYTLAASSSLHHVLARLGPVRVAFDFDLTHGDAEASTKPQAWLRSTVVEAAGVEGVVGIPREPVGHPDIAVLLPDGGRSRALASLAVEYGCVGWIRLDANAQWDESNLAELERGVREACEACLQSIFVDLARGESIPQRERCESLLLDHAARHLSLITQTDLQPRATVSSDLADRILTMPLFSATHGEAMTGWRVIRVFCAEFATAPSRARDAVLELTREDLSAHARSWIDRHLQEARVVIKPAPPPAPAPVGNWVGQDAGLLQDAVLHWLRVAGGLEFVTHVWVHGQDLDGLCSLEGSSVFINPAHPRTTTARQLRTPASLAWLLLGVFAHINTRAGDVENRHERAFQLEVAGALREGRLAWS
ncbi:MAG: hypothetical protein ACRBN8_20795 [Nannocystales bacterium]